MKAVLAAGFVTLVLISSIAGSWALALHSLHTSQHQWCTTLTLLTQTRVPKPADPAANPSREQAYLFYSHLKDLERSFGCG